MSLFHALTYHVTAGAQRLVSPPVREAAAILARGERADRLTLQEQRNRAFVSLVQHCYRHVPYYRRLMDEHGIAPGQVQSLADIERFPILTKDDIRVAGDRLRAANIPDQSCTWRRSGGTTGEPITVHLDPLTRAIETQAHLRGLHWLGWRPGVKIVKLWGGSLGRHNTRSLRTRVREAALANVFLPAFELNRENAGDYLAAIKHAEPCFLFGYSSAVYLLATYARDLGYRGLSVLAVIPTGAEMPAQWVMETSDAFQCPVLSYYGCAEINALGYQTAQAGPYIVPDEHVHVESTARKDAQEDDASPGDLLLTSLFNKAQPLLRYRVGDMGEVAVAGELHPTRHSIRILAGRGGDMFVLKNGTRISANFGGKIISALKPPIKRYQFVQWDHDEVEFRYEPLPGLTESHLAEISAVLRHHMGDDVNVDLTATDEYILGPTRKHRIMVSMLEAEAG